MHFTPKSSTLIHTEPLTGLFGEATVESYQLDPDEWWEARAFITEGQDDSATRFEAMPDQTQKTIEDNVRRALIIMADTVNIWLKYSTSLKDPGDAFMITLYAMAVDIDPEEYHTGHTSDDFRKAAEESRLALKEMKELDSPTESESEKVSQPVN